MHKIESSTLVKLLMCFALSIVTIIFNTTLKSCYFFAVVILLINIYAVIKSRNSWKLFIVFAFITWFNYSILIANILSPIGDFFTSWQKDAVMIPAVNILLMFNSIICFGIPNRIVNKDENFNNFIRNKPLICCGCILLLVLILIYTIVDSLTSQGRVTPSTFFEYAIILYLIGRTYSGNRKSFLVSLSILCVLYVIVDMVLGNRVTALQMLIAFFLTNFASKKTIGQILPFAIIGIVIFSMIGAVRTDFSFSMEGIVSTIRNMLSGKLTLDTAYSAYYTSLTFIKVRELTPFFDRLSMLGSFVLSVFAGGSVPNSNLAMYTHNYFTHYYGGILPYFGYFYLGYLGIVLISLYVLFLFRKLIYDKSHHNTYREVISIYFVACVPRWYLYSPSPLLRGMLILSILFFISDKVSISRQKNDSIRSVR